ncbi:GerAB/ArcD/ProY family transporter [Brevibacillus sp. H7]|uniref:GerAB/ArcD/ProY family transporter n=1 Tax=Brevibacillus sp. H7 TaxID=3349138 RepID=UPI00381C5E98
MKGYEGSPAISPIQLVLLVFGTVVGVGFLTLPRVVIEKAREDAWLTVILAGALLLVALWLVLRAARLFPEDTLIEYNVKVFGRVAGFVINLMFGVYLLFFTITGVRTMAEVVRAEMLPFTPTEAIIFGMLLTLLYAAWDGLMTIVRINESGQPITFLLMMFFFLFAYLEADWSELRVPFTNGLLPIIQPLPNTAYSYVGFEILFLYYPFVVKKDKSFRHAAAGIALAGGFYGFIVLGTLVTLGADVAIAQVYPVVTMAKVIEVVRQFVERAELLLLVLWLPLAFTTHLVTFYSTAFSLHRMVPVISFRIWMGLLVPVIYFLSQIPDNLIVMAKWSDRVGQAGMVFLFGYPLLLFAGVFVRRMLGLHPPPGKEGEPK